MKIIDSRNRRALEALFSRHHAVDRALLRRVDRLVTRDQLIDEVWGSDYVGDTKTLDVHVKRLREKIEPDPHRPRHLLTVRGIGYMVSRNPTADLSKF